MTTPSILALVPSRGHGGGVETYIDGVLEAVDDGTREIAVVPLLRNTEDQPGIRRKLAFVLESLRAARRLRRHGPLLILAFHPSLAVVARAVRRIVRPGDQELVVFLYGSDIWARSPLQRRTLRAGRAKLVTISSFSAGAIVDADTPALLPPGLHADRFRAFAAARATPQVAGIHDFVSVFRLADAAGKGAWAILAAGDLLRAQREDFTMTFLGAGRLPSDFAEEVRSRPWVRVMESPGLDELAAHVGAAHALVLATRTEGRRRGAVSGEGFGIVLVEAQLAGTAVIAPASGGSRDAFLPGLTGLRVRDETAEALAETMGILLDDPRAAEAMGRNGCRWAEEEFQPARYAQVVRSVLLGEPAPAHLPLQVTAFSTGVPQEP